MLPRRTRPHQVEDESRITFEAVMPSRHKFRPEHGEYGIDGEVEEFDESGEATGRRFRVQLKGTDKSGAPAMRERIKVTTAAYYRAQQLPVLMVRYVSANEQLYARWFHEFDPYYENLGKSHLTFHWSETDLLTPARFDEIFGQVERIVRLKSAGLTLPITVGIEIPSSGIRGSARAEMEVALDAALSRCPGVLLPVTTGQPSDLLIATGDTEIRASLSGLSTVTFHLESHPYSAETAPAEIAADALNAAAVALARAGHGDPAARLAVEFFPGSAFSAVAPLAGELAAAMAEAGRVVEVIEIADKLDESDEPSCRASGALLMEILRERSNALRPHEDRSFEAALRARLKRRLEAAQIVEAAAAAENIGRHLMTVRRPAEAVEPLAQAIELDPDRERGLIADLAGAFFLSNRYPESVQAYERALELAKKPDDRLRARWADALLYAGRYREAYKAFSAIGVDDRDLGTWIYVKTRALEWILAATGIEEQEPDPEVANRLAGRWPEVDTPEAGDELAAEVWRHDASSSLGWFNRARELLDRGLEREAMHAYLTAAVMREGDVEAWVNVAILAINTSDDSLFLASAVTAHRLNRESFLVEFARQLRATVADVAARDELLRTVKQAVEPE